LRLLGEVAYTLNATRRVLLGLLAQQAVFASRGSLAFQTLIVVFESLHLSFEFRRLSAQRLELRLGALRASTQLRIERGGTGVLRGSQCLDLHLQLGHTLA
jgi:hypothetical protein